MRGFPVAGCYVKERAGMGVPAGDSKGPYGTALARETIALALAPMEKQLFLALAYFVRKRLAKRLLLAF